MSNNCLQVVNIAAPLPKIRAVSPSCVRPQQHRVVTPSQPSSSQGPRGLLMPTIRPSPPIRPTAPIHLPNFSPVPGKVRIRAPMSSTVNQRPMRPAPPLNSQVNNFSQELFHHYFIPIELKIGSNESTEI